MFQEVRESKLLKNGRQMLMCECAECGATKTRFTMGYTGGAIAKNGFACGYDLKGKRAGTAEECFKKGQIRYWGLNRLDDGQIDYLLSDRKLDRNAKARARRKSKKPIKLPERPDPIADLRPDLDKKFQKILDIDSKMKFDEIMKNWKKETRKKKPAKPPETDSKTEKKRSITKEEIFNQLMIQSKKAARFEFDKDKLKSVQDFMDTIYYGTDGVYDNGAFLLKKNR